MKIFSLSQGATDAARRLLAVAALAGLCGAAHGATLHLPNKSAISVASVTAKRALFISITDVESKLPVKVLNDPEAGLSILCSEHDCYPVYRGDEREMLVTDTAVYVSAETVAKALGCRAKIKRKRDVHLSCAEGWPERKVGAEVGERAPGFRLKASADSSVALSDLLSRGPVVVAFVRSGEWDPLSRLLLMALESKLDSLRAVGCEVVAIHGYEPKFGARWAGELKLHFAQLADDASAVMRGYGVFDQGHLPRCALFLLDREGVIRYRQVYENDVALPDMEPILKKVRGMRDEG